MLPINLQNLKPQEYKSLKVEEMLQLPFTTKNGIHFYFDTNLHQVVYEKNECKGTIELDNKLYRNSVYGLLLKSKAYWTEIFGDVRGVITTMFYSSDTTESILERLSMKIEDIYTMYKKAI